MEHNYEKTQKFNIITQLFHFNRYKNLYKFIDNVQKQYTKHKTIKVLDIGCGVAKAYKCLDNRYSIQYVGVELRKDFVLIANERYAENTNFKIIYDSITNYYELFGEADVVIGLEILEHIQEAIVVEIIQAIASYNVAYFYCTVPNEIGPAVLIKNVGSCIMRYPRHKEYTWRETFFATIYNFDKVGIHGIKHKGFDWRWLAQTIRQNMKINSITTSPFNFIPRSISPSIGFMCSKLGSEQK